MSLREVQTQLASHIRNPDVASGPEGIEERRLKIYRDLFYNNIEGFLSSGFPVLRSLYDDAAWHGMVRDFMILHRCQSPYFLEISQEFLLYLQNSREPAAGDLPFLLELAHYEWVELGLDVAEDDLGQIECERDGNLLADLPVVSPLAWSLAYHFPVHRIGPDFQPELPGEQPTYLIVYRNRDDHVGFMETNAVTARLIEKLQTEDVYSGQEALEQIAAEIAHPEPAQMVAFGLELMQQLYSRDIILGTTPRH